MMRPMVEIAVRRVTLMQGKSINLLVSNMKIRNTVQKAFTLLELLVVIGVIGILLSLITVSFTNAQKQSRDTRRRQDIVAIQNALEQYYSQTSFVYPTCSGQACAAINSYFTGNAVPTDPLGTGIYVYTISSNSTSYTVSAKLEKDGSTVSVTNLQ